MYNSIVVAGYLVSDPEIKDTKNNSKVCKLRLCISEQNAKTPCYIDMELWDKQASIAHEYLSKGRRIIAQGELSQSTWEKDGKKFSKYFIRGQGFRFLGDGKNNESKDEPKSESKVSSGSSNDYSEDIPF
jgi:single-strand DNA-binding protein